MLAVAGVDHIIVSITRKGDDTLEAAVADKYIIDNGFTCFTNARILSTTRRQLIR